MSQLEKLIAKIQETAAKRTHADSDEEFNPCLASGGNYDDAYYMGIDRGEVLFARELLAIINATPGVSL